MEMDHVKTFFKTLLWTLVGIVVVVWWFWAYLRFFNNDLGAKVANLVYKTDSVECPVCLECEECEVCAETDVDCNCPEVEETCEVADSVDMTNQYEAMNLVWDNEEVAKKLDKILNILENWDSNIVVEKKKTPETLEDALKRIEELESGN